MSTITTSPDFFALANLASTLLLGAAFVLVAQISETLRSRRGVRRRDRQVVSSRWLLEGEGCINGAGELILRRAQLPWQVLLLLAVRIGNTGLDAFSR